MGSVSKARQFRRNLLLTNLTSLLNRWVMASVSEDGEWAKTNTMQVVKYSGNVVL